jgi:hypothetical protein
VGFSFASPVIFITWCVNTGGWGNFTIVFCLCGELYYFMTNCRLNSVFSYSCRVKYCAHTKEQTCTRRYKVSIVRKVKVQSKTQKHSAQICCRRRRRGECVCKWIVVPSCWSRITALGAWLDVG